MAEVSYSETRDGFIRILNSRHRKKKTQPADRGSLIEQNYKMMKARFGNLNQEDFTNAHKKAYLELCCTDEQLRNIYLGLNAGVPSHLLDYANWITRLKFFDGLGAKIQAMDPRYSVVHEVCSRDMSILEIVSHIAGQSKLDPNGFGSSLQDVVNDPLESMDSAEHYRRRDGSIRDVVSYLLTYDTGNHCSVQERKHQKVGTRVRKRLENEGYAVFTEVKLMTRQGLLGCVDVAGLRSDRSFVVYEVKSNSNLTNPNENVAAEQLQNAARFFFYNFGDMPETKAENGFPSQPYRISPPQVNQKLRGVFI